MLKLQNVQTDGLLALAQNDKNQPQKVDLDKKDLVLGLMTNQLVEAVHDHQQKLPYNPFQNKQIAIGQIRKGGQPFGDLLGILSFGHNPERDSGTFMMTMPGMGPNGESVSCILGSGLDWQFFNYDGTRAIPEDSL